MRMKARYEIKQRIEHSEDKINQLVYELYVHLAAPLPFKVRE